MISYVNVTLEVNFCSTQSFLSSVPSLPLPTFPSLRKRSKLSVVYESNNLFDANDHHPNPDVYKRQFKRGLR